ncbi:hypothetical protein C7974DRAFT_112142 [Boeremia exigua]|uniref:uncharacterized protein n=1 Tax=Boeremia exigua TaxID=749465 RepID=UPI001E8CDFDE|nr:uncharacterized protein C7974DRAFT_112142 [Boeremia exigua]KAH6642867.1 hypothetical protein C7974DRAFT_112142 [Boeremia exigua]
MPMPGFLRLPTELVEMICCAEDYDYISICTWYTRRDTRLLLLRDLRLTCHHLHTVTRRIFVSTYKNQFPLARFSLEPRSLAVLLHIAKDPWLLSKIRQISFHKARIFSYQNRIEYEKSPELVYILTRIFHVLRHAKSPIHAERWAGGEAFMTAVLDTGYKENLTMVVTAPGADKRDLMERQWLDLGHLGVQSFCLDHQTIWGAGNPYVHDPSCGTWLPGLRNIVNAISPTLRALTVRYSVPGRSSDGFARSWAAAGANDIGYYSPNVCHTCPLDTVFVTYFCSHVFPNLKVFTLKNATVGETSLIVFLQNHSSSLTGFTASGATLYRGSWRNVLNVLMGVRSLQYLVINRLQQHAFRGITLRHVGYYFDFRTYRTLYPKKPNPVTLSEARQVHAYLVEACRDQCKWLRDQGYCMSELGCYYSTDRLECGLHPLESLRKRPKQVIAEEEEGGERQDTMVPEICVAKGTAMAVHANRSSE